MPRVSPHATRRQTRSHRGDASDDSDNSGDRSNASYRSRLNDSPYRNHSSSHDANRTASNSSFLSESLNDSSSFSSIGLYPSLSDDLNEPGDSNFTKINEKKAKNLYPTLETSIDSKERQTTPLRSPYQDPRSSPSKKRQAGKSNESGNCAQVLCVIVVVIGIIFALLYLVTRDSSTNSLSADSKLGFDYFENELITLKSSFPNQTNRFWATVSASAKHVFEQQDPCYPSVILVASHSKNKALTSCLSKKIASTFNSSFGVNSRPSTIGIDVENFKHMDPDQQKLHVDEAMQVTFQQHGGKAFVISNVHLLSPRAALLLHGFCDGDNAPFKDVMIILTFQVDDGTVFNSVKEVEGLLTKIWSQGLHMDKLSALMSRIANNPVVLMGENKGTVDKFCS